MDKRKIIIIATAAGVIICLVIVFFLYFYKGTVVLNPRNQGTTVYLNNAEYTEFPVSIKIKGGNYYLRTKKDGYLDQNEKITVRPFKKTDYEPSLKKVSVVGYINGPLSNPSLSNKKDELYFYSPQENALEKISIYSSEKAPEDMSSTAISDNNLTIEGFGDNPIIKWSSNKKNAIFITNKVRKIINLESKQALDVPEGIKTIDFVGDNQLVYTQNNSIYRSDIGLTSPEKMGVIKLNATGSAISPSSINIAFWDSGKLSIFSLEKKTWLKDYDKKIVNLIWKDEDSFALSNDQKDGLLLEAGSIATDKTKTLGELYSNEFVWSNNSLIFTTEDKGKVYLKIENADSTNEKTIYETTIRNKLNIISTDNNKLLFSIGTVLYSLGI